MKPVLHHRILLLGIELEGTVDGAPDVGDAVTALGTEHLRHREALLQGLGDVLLLNLEQDTPVGGGPEHRGRRQVRTGVIVHESGKLPVEGHHVVRILRGEVRHLAGGDVDLDDVLVVRILARGGGQAVGIGQDETALLVHLVDLTDVPFPAGDLAHRKRLGVNDIQVPPVVPFRDPQDMLSVLEQIAPEVVVIDERVSLFLRQRADLAGRGVHGGEFIDLVAALVVLIGEEVRIRGPLAQGQEILVPRDGPVQGDGLPGLHVEQGRGALRQPVAGFRIVQPAVTGLYLVVGAGDAEQDLALLEHLLLQGRELLAVRRPLDLRIGLAVGPVKAQLAGLLAIGLGNPDVVVPDEGDERAVRRKTLHFAPESVLTFVGGVVIISP